MTDSKKDKQFNETLKLMMDAKPKPHEEMKKGRKIKSASVRPLPEDGKSIESEK